MRPLPRPDLRNTNDRSSGPVEAVEAASGIRCKQSWRRRICPCVVREWQKFVSGNFLSQRDSEALSAMNIGWLWEKGTKAESRGKGDGTFSESRSQESKAKNNSRLLN